MRIFKRHVITDTCTIGTKPNDFIRGTTSTGEHRLVGKLPFLSIHSGNDGQEIKSSVMGINYYGEVNDGQEIKSSVMGINYLLIN